MKDWKHLEQAISGILHGCSDELDTKSFNKFVRYKSRLFSLGESTMSELIII